MDALSHELLTIRLHDALFARAGTNFRWYLPPVPRVQIAGQINSLGRAREFYIVTEGKFLTYLPGRKMLEVRAGELAIYPVEHCELIFELNEKGSKSSTGNSMQDELEDSSSVSLVCMVAGHFLCGEFIASLLTRMTVQNRVHIQCNPSITRWLKVMMKACMVEIDTNPLPRSIVLEKYVEMMLMEALRQFAIDKRRSEDEV